jgi:hypothetical protein
MIIIDYCAVLCIALDVYLFYPEHCWNVLEHYKQQSLLVKFRLMRFFTGAISISRQQFYKHAVPTREPVSISVIGCSQFDLCRRPVRMTQTQL